MARGKPGKSKRPPAKSSPAVKYAADRAIARSEGKEPEAVPLPKELGPPPAGMSAGEVAPSLVARLKAEARAELLAEQAKAKEKRKRSTSGRHSKFTPELGEFICALIAECSTVPDVIAALETDKGVVIAERTFYNWLKADVAFMQDYARAREAQADHDADTIRVIVRRVIDPTTPDIMKLDANQARVAIDAHKWIAARRNPKVYGDKVTLSNDPVAPITGVFLEVVDAPKQIEG